MPVDFKVNSCIIRQKIKGSVAMRGITYYLKQAPVIFILFATSFASICIETVAIYYFSINTGYIYFHISLLTSTLLIAAALSCGITYLAVKKSAFLNKYLKPLLLSLDIIMITLIAALAFFLDPIFTHIASYYTLLALTGIVLGAQFSLVAAKIVTKEHVMTDYGHIYAADLIGGGIFLIVFLRLLPLVGISAILYAALALKALSFFIFLLIKTTGDAMDSERRQGAGRTKIGVFHLIIPFVYGVSVIITQSLLIRMMIVNVGYSYISFGFPLGVWLLGAAAGSYCTAFIDIFKKDNLSLSIITLSGITVPIAVFASLYYGWEFNTVSFNLTFYFILIFLVSFVSGMIFPLLCHYFKDTDFVYLTYAIEGIGAFTGGVIFAFYNFSFSDFSISLISALIILTLALLISLYQKRTFLAVVISVVYILFVTLFIFHDKLDTKWMQNQQTVRNETILFYKYTKSGRVEVVVENLTKNMAVYVDRVLQYSLADDKVHNESMAYLAYYHTKAPLHALVIGGGIGGLARELLKFNLKSIDYVEIEPAFNEIGKRYFSKVLGDTLNNERLNIVYEDGFKFVNDAYKTYDIIILDIPSPSNLQLSRFFSKEFFLMARDLLNPGGTFVLPLIDSITFQGEKFINLSVHNTLNEVFVSKKVMLPFYYIPKVKSPKKETDFIKKPYFELVICSNEDYMKKVDYKFFFDNISNNEQLQKSPLSKRQYIRALFDVSKVYFDRVYADSDFKGISTLDKMLPLHYKWKYSTDKINPATSIITDSSGDMIIKED